MSVPCKPFYNMGKEEAFTDLYYKARQVTEIGYKKLFGTYCSSWI